MASGSPTVRRRRLGIEMRRLRSEASMTLEFVAAQLSWSHAKVSRLETGHGRVSVTDIDALARLYGVTDELREVLMTLARESRAKGWWRDFSDALPSWFNVYVGLESAAGTLRNYETEFVPGLLQIEDYVREIYRAGRPRTPAEIDRLVQVRLERQRVLDREPPPGLWVIVNESVIRRMTGGRDLMKRQMQRILTESERPEVTVQVLPFSAGAHPAMDGAFMILGFPDDDPDVVYRESMTDALYVEHADDVRLYAAAFDHLRARSLDPDVSRGLIMNAIKEY